MLEVLGCRRSKFNPLNCTIIGLPNYHWALDRQLLQGTDPVCNLTKHCLEIG